MTETTYAIQYRPKAHPHFNWVFKETGFQNLEQTKRYLEDRFQHAVVNDYRIVRVEITEVE